MTSQQPNSSPSKKRPLDIYAKYSVIGFQMAAIIFGLTYAGIKLDDYFKLNFPAFTVSLGLLSIIAAIYFAIRDLIKFPSRNKEKRKNN